MSEGPTLDTEVAAEPLPRGRHKLPSAVVQSDQRRRLMNAMLKCVAEQGYETTTVPKVVALARVSTNTFYAFFKDKLDCFLCVCNELAVELWRTTTDGLPQDDWEAATRESLRRYLGWWRERPAFARAYFVELPTAGIRAIEQRQAAYEHYVRLFAGAGAWARMQRDDLAELREVTPWLLTWAITDLIAAEVLAGRAASLDSIEDDVLWLLLRLLAEPV